MPKVTKSLQIWLKMFCESSVNCLGKIIFLSTLKGFNSFRYEINDRWRSVLPFMDLNKMATLNFTYLKAFI